MQKPQAIRVPCDQPTGGHTGEPSRFLLADYSAGALQFKMGISGGIWEIWMCFYTLYQYVHFHIWRFIQHCVSNVRSSGWKNRQNLMQNVSRTSLHCIHNSTCFIPLSSLRVPKKIPGDLARNPVSFKLPYRADNFVSAALNPNQSQAPF